MKKILRLYSTKLQCILIIIFCIISITIQKSQAQVKQGQTITFVLPSIKTVLDESFRLWATSSAGIPLLYSSSSTDIVYISHPILGYQSGVGYLFEDSVFIANISRAGTVSITAYNTGDNNYAGASTTQILTILKANQSISFFPIEQNRTFGDLPFQIFANVSTSLPVYFSASNTLVRIDANTVTIRRAGTVRITTYQTGDQIYLPDSVFNIFTIHKARQNISLETLANRTIGDAPFVLSATSSAGLTVLFSASSTLVSIGNNTVTINGTGTVSITAFQTGNENYIKADSVIRILTINKANQSISFETLAQKTFGDAPFVLTATSSAGLPVLFSASSSLVNISNNTVTINGAGTVSITAYNTGNENYGEASAIQILLINDFRKKNATITFTTPSTLTVGQSYILTATTNSPMPITFTSSNTIIVLVSGNTFTGKAVGTVTITASQEENAEYNAITAQQTITIVGVCYTPPHYFLTSIGRENSAIRIFPNHTTGYITIQADKTQSISSVRVYSITGREVMMSNGVHLDVQTLPKDTYIVVVYGEMGDVLKAEKVIKE